MGQEASEQLCVLHTGVDTLTLLTSPEPTYHTLDYVAGPGSSQEHMFKVVGRPIVENALAGFNSTIFAYGQTGSGKTHTMLGRLDDGDLTDPDSPAALPDGAGLIPRTFAYLFRRISDLEEGLRQGREVSFAVSVALVEIYKEQITDLLGTPGCERVQLREDKQAGVFLEGVGWHAVTKVEEVLRLLLRGAASRHTAATRLNDTSSRSHMLLQCRIESQSVEEGTGVVRRRSMLSLVDLAGSERQKAAETEGDRLKEAQAINKSLFTLGQVINKLTDGSSHVPYRESKLTLLLRESLGGNSRTVIIPTIAPTVSSLAETANTLKFAARAKQIKNQARVNEDVSQSAVEMAAEVARLRAEVAVLRGHAAGRSPSSRGEGGDFAASLALNEQLEGRLRRLQEQLGRLRQERDAFEAASHGKEMQVQLAEEAAAAAEVRAHELVAALSAAEQARSDAEADLQQGAAELQGLVAEAAQQAAREEAATAAAAEQAAALAAKQRQVELLRAQLAARDAQASSSKRHRWVQQRLAVVEATQAAMQDQHERLLQLNRDLVAERDELKRKLASSEVRCTNAAAVMASYQEQIASLRSERAALQDAAQKLAATLAERGSELQALAKRNGELSMELDNVRSVTGREHERIGELRAAVSSAREELDTLRRGKEEACRRATAAQQQLLERTTEAAQLQRQLAEATQAAGCASAGMLDGLRRQIAELKEEAMRTEATAAFESKSRAQLKREHARLVQEHAQLMQEHAQLDTRHAEVLANLEKEAAATTSLNEASSNAAAARADLAKQLAEARAEVDMLESSVSTLRRERARQAAELAVAEQARAKLQAEVDALRAQRDGADAELADAAGELQCTTMDMEQLKVPGCAALPCAASILP
ncbi:hypothetical protein ABPG77_008625 [Micractinium sp. CCAP 211/92]